MATQHCDSDASGVSQRLGDHRTLHRRDRRVRVGQTPTEVAEIAAEMLGAGAPA
jgi:hypothetical protein